MVQNAAQNARPNSPTLPHHPVSDTPKPINSVQIPHSSPSPHWLILATQSPAPKHPNTFQLFYHGTVTINRGIGLVLKALSEIKEDVNIKFTIVGDGSGLEELKAMAQSCSLLSRRVIFKGLLPYEKMVTEINHADVCICPLTDRVEWDVSSPIKVFEYLACGKPIILTPISAHRDVVEGKPYIVWTKGFKPSDFSEAIVRAIEKKNTLTFEAKKAADFVKLNYQWKNQAEKLKNYLDKTYSTALPKQ
ncbi:MAG: glycosyltransferase [Candidatus Marinimicrobia bacterium]|nr:glycosyltransferase [Candidatus Neomarinimicrobiota bacterium]